MKAMQQSLGTEGPAGVWLLGLGEGLGSGPGVLGFLIPTGDQASHLYPPYPSSILGGQSGGQTMEPMACQVPPTH